MEQRCCLIRFDKQPSKRGKDAGNKKNNLCELQDDKLLFVALKIAIWQENETDIIISSCFIFCCVMKLAAIFEQEEN